MFKDFYDRIWEKSIEAFLFYETVIFLKNIRSNLCNVQLIKPQSCIKTDFSGIVQVCLILNLVQIGKRVKILQQFEFSNFYPLLFFEIIDETNHNSAHARNNVQGYLISDFVQIERGV